MNKALMSAIGILIMWVLSELVITIRDNADGVHVNSADIRVIQHRVGEIENEQGK